MVTVQEPSEFFALIRVANVLPDFVIVSVIVLALYEYTYPVIFAYASKSNSVVCLPAAFVTPNLITPQFKLYLKL